MADRWGPPRTKKKFLLFLARIHNFWENGFVGAALYRATPTNLEPHLQIRFVGTAGEPPLQISDLLQQFGRGGWRNRPYKCP